MFEPLGPRLGDGTPGRHAADKGQAGHQRVRHQRFAALAAGTDDVDDAGRHDAIDQFHHAVRGQRRLVGRLHDDHVAGDQGRAHLAGREHDRVVVGDDAGHHAVGLAHAHVDYAFTHRHGLPLDLGDQAGTEVDHRRGHDGVVLHLADRVAAVRRIDHGQLVGVGAQHRSDLFHKAGPLQRFHLAPDLKALVCRLHRRVHIRGVGLGTRTQALAGGRVPGIEVAAGGLVPGPAVVEIAVFRQHRLVTGMDFDEFSG